MPSSELLLTTQSEILPDCGDGGFFMEINVLKISGDHLRLCSLAATPSLNPLYPACLCCNFHSIMATVSSRGTSTSQNTSMTLSDNFFPPFLRFLVIDVFATQDPGSNPSIPRAVRWSLRSPRSGMDKILSSVSSVDDPYPQTWKPWNSHKPRRLLHKSTYPYGAPRLNC